MWKNLFQKNSFIISKLSSICCTYCHTQLPDFVSVLLSSSRHCRWTLNILHHVRGDVDLSVLCWADGKHWRWQTLKHRLTERVAKRLQNGVINVREECRLWHGWVVWGMREWFDSRVQDVPIRWIYFPWIDRRLRRRLVTHSLHPLFSKHNRTKLHFHIQVIYLTWVETGHWKLSATPVVTYVCLYLWVCLGPDVVLQQLSFEDHHTHHQCDVH